MGFNLLLKMGVEDIDIMSYGRLHSLGEDNENAVSCFLIRLREFWIHNLYSFMVWSDYIYLESRSGSLGYYNVAW